MTTLVVGASGATGRLLVQQLCERGEHVRAIVRGATSLPESIADHKNLTLINANLLDLSDAELARHVRGCDAIASCLGHNLTFKGIFGQPRRLVTDATRRLCQAVKENAPVRQVKFVLMNTTGNSNRDLNEAVPLSQRCVIGLLRVILPPHVDNEQAADYLRTQIGPNDPAIQWAAVRPDALVDQETVSEYEIHPSPIRNAIFNAGKVSRINVAHFMAELISNDQTWDKWKGQMPVIYSKT